MFYRGFWEQREGVVLKLSNVAGGSDVWRETWGHKAGGSCIR